MPTPNDFLVTLPVLVLLAWALLVLLADLWIPESKKNLTAVLTAVGLVFSLAVTVTQAGKTGSAFNGMIMLDGFSTTLSILFMISGLAAVALAVDYLKRNNAERGEYYTLLLFSIAGMMLMASAADLIIVFLALELLSIPLYVLAGFFRPNLASEEAALKYFLMGAFSSAFLLFGVAWVYGATGHTDFKGIIDLTAAGKANPILMLVGGGLILVGLGFKVGVFPFHGWVPDTYQGAPSSIGAFMTVATKAAGFAGLLRVFAQVFSAQSLATTDILWVLAAASMVYGNVTAIAQANVKRMLAYSSIANAGYILMAFVPFGGAVILQSLSSAVFYLMAYALTSFTVWAVMIAIEPAGSDGLTFEDFSGLAKKNPWLGGALLISMLSFTGLPLTMGFWGKFYLFKTAVDGGFNSLALIGLLTSLVSAYYYLRLVMFAWFKSGEPELQPGKWAGSVAIVMAAGVLLLSLFPNPLFQVCVNLMTVIR
ncbi:MAG: NADH-quinone oxidoreductase subunit N [Chloroflexi bacterium]|nr:NADH-quinone oxidoreductase subunit N [Chloroflexota bacterium]